MKINSEEFVNILESYKANIQAIKKVNEVLSEEFVEENIEPGFFALLDSILVDIGINVKDEDSILDNWLWDWGDGSIPIEWEEDDEGQITLVKSTKDLYEAYEALVPENCKC